MSDLRVGGPLKATHNCFFACYMHAYCYLNSFWDNYFPYNLFFTRVKRSCMRNFLFVKYFVLLKCKSSKLLTHIFIKIFLYHSSHPSYFQFIAKKEDIHKIYRKKVFYSLRMYGIWFLVFKMPLPVTVIAVLWKSNRPVPITPEFWNLLELFAKLLQSMMGFLCSGDKLSL